MGWGRWRSAVWVPWIVLVLCSTAWAFAPQGTAAAGSVSPASLRGQLLTSQDLGAGWTRPSDVEAITTRDTWTPSSCWAYTTEYGGPLVREYFMRSRGLVGTIEETIAEPSVNSTTVFHMMLRCGPPKGSPPRPKGAGASHTVPSHSTSLFSGLGQGAFGIAFTSELDNGKARSIGGTVLKGPEIISLDYIGTASQSQVRQWAVEAVSKIQGQ